MIKTERNPKTGILEAMIPAVLTKMSPANRTLINENGSETAWGLATAEITYPDGETEEVQACMWAKNQDDIFSVGQSIILRTQIDGDHVGNAVVALPEAKRVNVNKFEFATEDVPVSTNA